MAYVNVKREWSREYPVRAMLLTSRHAWQMFTESRDACNATKQAENKYTNHRILKLCYDERKERKIMWDQKGLILKW